MEQLLPWVTEIVKVVAGVLIGAGGIEIRHRRGQRRLRHAEAHDSSGPPDLQESLRPFIDDRAALAVQPLLGRLDNVERDLKEMRDGAEQAAIAFAAMRAETGVQIKTLQNSTDAQTKILEGLAKSLARLEGKLGVQG